MPYDPQRSHRRPQLADDGPAPIDALLDHADTDAEPAPTEPVPSTEPVASTEPAVVSTSSAPTLPDGAFDEIEVAAATDRGRPRLALLAAALLVLVLVFAWVRRRR